MSKLRPEVSIEVLNQRGGEYLPGYLGIQMTELGQLSQIGRMSVMGRMSQMGNLVQLGRASTRFDARLDSPGNRPSMWGGAVLPTDLPAQLQSEEVKPLRVLFETMRLDSKATITPKA